MSIKSALSTSAALAFFFLLTTPAMAQDENILGGWRIIEMEEPVPGKMYLTFKKGGLVEMMMFIKTGQPPVVMRGQYTANDGNLTMKMSDGLGGEFKYRIDGKKMTVIEVEEDGKVLVTKLERLELE